MGIGSIENAYPIGYWNDRDPLIARDFFVSPWFSTSAPREVSEREIGWLLAQGWVITRVREDATKPPEKWYTIQRSEFQNTTTLQTLLDKYVSLFNEGRATHDQRFDDLMFMYQDLVTRSESHLNRQAAAVNTFDTVYVNSLDSLVTQIDFYLNATRTQSSAVFDDAVLKLNEFSAKLAELGTGHSSFETQMTSLLATQQTSLSQFTGRVATALTNLSSDYTSLRNDLLTLEGADDTTLSAHVSAYDAKLTALETAVTTTETQLLSLIDDFETAYTEYRTQALDSISDIEGEVNSLVSSVNSLLTSIDSEITTHETTYEALLDLFVSDYTSHAATSRALLVDLGTAEEARIQEHWTAEKSRKAQKLVDRGFYSSGLIADSDARVERERSEDLGNHRDKLAREKLANEHQLFTQLFQVRDKRSAGEAYIHSLKAAAFQYRAEWAARLCEQAKDLQNTTVTIHASIRDAKNGYLSQELGVREKVFGWGQDAKAAVLRGKDQIHQFRQVIEAAKRGNRQLLGEALNRVRSQSSTLYGQELDARHRVDAFAGDAREKIVTLLNAYIAQHANGMRDYVAAADRNGEFLDGVRQRAAATAMQARMALTSGFRDVNTAQQQLMQFQLDSRNNLAVGMFGMMERRDDAYVDFPHMSQLIVDLAASGPTQWAGR